MTEDRPKYSRRRVIAGAGAGAAAVWAAPAVTTLGRAGAQVGAAGSKCSVFLFDTAQLSVPAQATLLGNSSNRTGTFTAVGSLAVGSGNVDFVGPGTDWLPSAGYPATLAIDLTGGAGVTTTTLTGISLGPNTYIVEVEGYGARGGGTNSIQVKIGADTFIPLTAGPLGVTTPFTFVSSPSTGTTTPLGGVLELTHISSGADFEGLFLTRLEVFLAKC